MSKKEYLAAIKNTSISEDKVAKIEKKYNVKLNEELAKIISLADKSLFFDEERRALSFDEIVDPVKNLDIDFINEGMIPLVDTFDLTYIVYVIKDNKWAIYSQSDDCVFKICDLFSDVI